MKQRSTILAAVMAVLSLFVEGAFAKNKKNDPNRLEFRKYCSHERRHTLHREAK